MLVDKLWIQFGAIGLLIIFLIIAIGWLAKRNKCIMTEHRAERDEWRAEAREQTGKVIAVVEKNATAMSELGTLIQRKCK